MPFAPGQSGNPAGRPKGSVNRKWADISYWFDIIEANIGSVSPAQKIEIAKWAMAILIDKTKSIDDPEASKRNAEDAMLILKEMEAKAGKRNPTA